MTEPTSSKYLKYLPAIYQDPNYPDLGQFLVPFEQVLTGFENLISEISRFWEPDQTEKEFLPWLATWVALVLDEGWPEDTQRQLLSEAVELYRMRGTVAGLKRYLEIYTGLEPEIIECCWPSGFQIGVSSQVGGFSPEDSALLPEDKIYQITRLEPINYYDYYVITGIDNAQYYYRAIQVEKVEINAKIGEITIFPINNLFPQKTLNYKTISRRNHLVDDVHTFAVERNRSGKDLVYHGDTFLVGAEERPYQFIVDVHIQESKKNTIPWDKVRAIVDLEKPAHTQYYLKLTLVTDEYKLLPMQIGIRSKVGIDTYVG